MLRSTTTPGIHLPWIGTPSSTSSGVPAHDTWGPIEIAKVYKDVPKFFWCWEIHVPHYEKILNPHGIDVCSIERHLELSKHRFKSATEKVWHIIRSGIYEEGRNIIRDRVSCKVMWVLFLGLTIGNLYAFDTNIRPKDSKAMPALPSHSKLRLPALCPTPTKATDFDCWMIYFPENHSTTSAMLDAYYTMWLEAEKIYDKEGYSANFYSKLKDGVMPVFFDNDKDIQCWFPELSHKEAYALIKEYNLLKNYYNTHTLLMRNEYEVDDGLLRQEYITFLNQTSLNMVPTRIKNTILGYCNDEKKQFLTLFRRPPKGKAYNELFAAIYCDDTEKLIVLLANTGNIHQTLITGETLFHIAVKESKPRCLEILLAQKGIDSLLRETASYSDGMFTPLQLAVAREKNGECHRLLMKHFNIVPSISSSSTTSEPEIISSLDDDDNKEKAPLSPTKK